jgi:hypothetical protein
LTGAFSCNRPTSRSSVARLLQTARQVRVSNVKYVLDRVNRRDRYSMKMPLRSSPRGASFHTKNASNANVARVVLLDANSYLALWWDIAAVPVSGVGRVHGLMRVRGSAASVVQGGLRAVPI